MPGGIFQWAAEPFLWLHTFCRVCKNQWGLIGTKCLRKGNIPSHGRKPYCFACLFHAILVLERHAAIKWTLPDGGGRYETENTGVTGGRPSPDDCGFKSGDGGMGGVRCDRHSAKRKRGSRAEQTAANAIHAGCDGFLLKTVDPQKLHASLLSIVGGIHVFDESVMASLREPAAARDVQRFSGRELEILRFLCQGMTNPEIAEQLGLKAGTVKNLITLLFSKTNCSSRSQLVRYAVTHHVVE